MEQWRFQAAQRAILTLQGYAKQFKIRRMIHKIRCRKIRPVVVYFKSLTNLKLPNYDNSKPIFVCMKVIDTPGRDSAGLPVPTSSSSSKEYWRFDSTDAIAIESDKIHATDRKTFHIDLEEAIILPGITGHQMIVFDVLQRAHIGGKEVFIGQCCLRFDKVWNSGGSFVLSLKYMEYPPAPKFNNLGKKITLDYSPFLEQMALLQLEAKRRVQENKHEKSGNSNQESHGHMSASEKITGILNFSTDVKKFTHARCGYVIGSSADDVCKYLKYHTNALSVQFPTKCETAMRSNTQKSGGTFALKKLWVAVIDEFMYIYQTFGGVLRYKINLKYCNIETIELNDHPGVLIKPSKLDIYGYGKLSPMQFAASVRRECLDWITSLFAAKRSAEGIKDLLIIHEDIERAKAKEMRKNEIYARKQGERLALKGRSPGEMQSAPVNLSMHQLLDDR